MAYYGRLTKIPTFYAKFFKIVNKRSNNKIKAFYKSLKWVKQFSKTCFQNKKTNKPTNPICNTLIFFSDKPMNIAIAIR